MQTDNVAAVVADRAKELLAEAFERSGEMRCAESVRRGHTPGFGTPLWMDQALDALTRALTPPAEVSGDVEEVARPTEAMIDIALHAVVPGGAEVWCWLPQKDAWTPHETARDVMRAALRPVLRTLAAENAALRGQIKDMANEAMEHAEMLGRSNARATTREGQIAELRAGLEDAQRYIVHVGANQTERGLPHPQQLLLDRLRTLTKGSPDVQ